MEKDKPECKGELLVKTSKGEISGYPVDHGWSWVVMLGCFGMHILNIGGQKSFGVLFVEFQRKFSASSSEIGGVYSFSNFLLFALGPIANALGDRFGYRCVVISGGILITLGLLLSSFIKTLWLLYVCYGLIAGIGFGLSYSPFIVMVGHHFEKRRSFAMGMSVSGSGVGSFIFPNMLRMMLDYYSLSQVILIHAAIMANLCVCGALIRPTEFYTNHQKRPSSVKKKRLDDKDASPKKIVKLNKKGDSVVTQKLTKYSKPITGVTTNARQTNSVRLTSGSFGELVIIPSQIYSDDNQKNSKDDKRKINLFSYKRHTEDSSGLLDCSLLVDPVFLIYSFTLLLASFGYFNVFFIIPSHVKQMEMTDTQAAFMVSLTGLFDIFGRLLFGWIADFKLCLRQYQFFMSIFLCAISIGTIPFLTDFMGLAVICSSIGFFGGAYIALIPVVLVDILGLKKLSSSLGLSLLFVSIGILLGPPIAGYIRDVNDMDWKNSLFFCSALPLIGSFMVILEPFAKRHKKKQENEKMLPLPMEDESTDMKSGYIRDVNDMDWKNSLFFCSALPLIGSFMVILEPFAKRHKKKQENEKMLPLPMEAESTDMKSG